MMTRRSALFSLVALLAVGLLASACCAQAPVPYPGEPGFTYLFNGENLDGWMGGQYVVEDGMLVCPADGGGTILTEKEYTNFLLRFDFRLEPGGNNGLAIRTPAEGNPAYVGMELQILDNEAPQYADLGPAQYHGSIYDVVPAKRGALREPGKWNRQEVYVNEDIVRVKLNGRLILDADLSQITDPAVLDAHPGLRRYSGHIGFMGHGDRLEFRNLRIQELPRHNVAPEGFVALFNGNDLTNWKGLVASPPERAAMSPAQLAEAQATADERMRTHWVPTRGVLLFDGGGDSLCTIKDYADFEMYVDWKILPAGDSGIYLRGSPQVQIWEMPEIGSGGLYNNQENPSQPLSVADNPVGEWNTFRIIMIGERVTVYLNDQLVVDKTIMENYWERDKPIYPIEQIELQNHGNILYFRNVYIREITDGVWPD